MRALLLTVTIALVLAGFWRLLGVHAERQQAAPQRLPWVPYYELNLRAFLPVATRFDPPWAGATEVRPRLLRGFQERGLLGEIWSLLPGTADVGQPVRAMGDGLVLLADDFDSTWGGVVLIVHRLQDDWVPPDVETLYANLRNVQVEAGSLVTRGQVIGEVGAVENPRDGHLHIEVRTVLGRGLGPSESPERDGWESPSAFLDLFGPPPAAP